MSKKLIPVCDECLGNDLTSRATVSWSDEAQEWSVVVDVDDETYCSDCQDDVSFTMMTQEEWDEAVEEKEREENGEDSDDEDDDHEDAEEESGEHRAKVDDQYVQQYRITAEDRSTSTSDDIREDIDTIHHLWLSPAEAKAVIARLGAEGSKYGCGCNICLVEGARRAQISAAIKYTAEVKKAAGSIDTYERALRMLREGGMKPILSSTTITIKPTKLDSNEIAG